MDECHLLAQCSYGVADGCDEAQDHTDRACRLDRGVACADRDERDARKGDRHANDQRSGETLLEDEAGDEGDQDGTDVDDQRGGPCIQILLGGVERDVVGAEPDDAIEDDHSERPAGGNWLATRPGDGCQRDGACDKSSEGQRACRERVADGADPDERRSPEQNGDQQSWHRQITILHMPTVVIRTDANERKSAIMARKTADLESPAVLQVDATRRACRRRSRA